MYTEFRDPAVEEEPLFPPQLLTAQLWRSRQGLQDGYRTAACIKTNRRPIILRGSWMSFIISVPDEMSENCNYVRNKRSR